MVEIKIIWEKGVIHRGKRYIEKSYTDKPDKVIKLVRSVMDNLYKYDTEYHIETKKVKYVDGNKL